jgi:serine/threonine-protein kinase
MTNKHCTQCGSPCPEEALFCSQCGNALHRADRDPLIGQTIAARYHLVERIGQGGAGTLYRAEHVTLRRRMAVKLLHHQLSANEEAVERFRREAITVCEIDNDHILQVHDFGRADDGRLFFAMEYLEGEPLSALLEREGALPFERAIDIMGQIADGLMEAHALGYVHRDLRPRNVFLTRRRGKSDFVKLLDFGLSKLVQPDSDAARTAMGMTFGNPQYMAPEQARGEVVDRRADIYSLGAIGFEMLTGQPPFRGSGTFDILSKVLDAPVPRVRELRPDCPEWLESVVRVSLAKSAADRFATVAQVVEALERKQVLERQPPLTIQVGPLKDPGALMEKMTPMTVPSLEAPPAASKPAQDQPIAEGKQGGRQTRAYEAIKLDEAPQSKGGNEDGRGQRLTRKERREQERKGKQTRLEIKPLDMNDRKAREAAARQIAEQAAREAAQVEELQREAVARKKAEEEAARKKAEEEAARKKAEEEAARKKAEEEAARKKAEEEAARKRAEEEAARKRAEEEAARKRAEEEAARRRNDLSGRAKAAARIMQPSARSPSPNLGTIQESLPAEQAREPSARVAMDRESIAKEAAAWEEAAQQLLSMAEADALAPAAAVPEPIPDARPQLAETVVAPAPNLAETVVAPAPNLAETVVAPAPQLDEDATVPMPRTQGEGLPHLADPETKTASPPSPQLTGEHEWFDSEAAGAASAAIEEYEPEKRKLPAMAGVIAAGVALLAIGSLVLFSKGKRSSEGEAATNPFVAQPAPAQVTPPTPAPAPAQVTPPTPAPAPAQVTPPTPAPAPAQVTPPTPAPTQAAQPASAQVTPPAPTPIKPPESPVPVPSPAPAPIKQPAAPPAKELSPPPAPAKEPAAPAAPAKEPAAAKPGPAKEPVAPQVKAPASPPPAVLKEPAAAKPAPVKPAAAKEPPKAIEPPAKKPEGPEAGGDKKEEVDELLQAGRQKLQGGDVSGAAASFNKAKDLDGRSAEAFAGLGEVAFEQGNWDDAVQKLLKAIKLAPRRASYQVLLGQSLYKLGRYKDAAEACRKALKLDPSLREAQQTLEAAEKKLDPDE